MLDLSGVLAPKEGRGIEAITQEILDAKRRGGEAILTIGRCLTEAKQAIPHGEWLPWLNERVEFSDGPPFYETLPGVFKSASVGRFGSIEGIDAPGPAGQ